MMHSMLFFWHRYELPAVVLGRVSPEHPRQGQSTASPTATPSTPSDTGRITPDETAPVNPPQPIGTVGRTQSFNTIASGRMSRNSSNNGMFHRGDDDDEGSYMYFMGGEVVIPRIDRRSTSPFAPTRANSARHDPAAQFAEAAEPRTNGEQLANGLEPPLVSTLRDEDSEQVRSTIVETDRQREESSDDFYLDDNETSALQAIINVMDEEESSTVTNASDVSGTIFRAP